MHHEDFMEWLCKRSACAEGRAFVSSGKLSARETWEQLQRPDWLLWMYTRDVLSLSPAEHAAQFTQRVHRLIRAHARLIAEILEDQGRVNLCVSHHVLAARALRYLRGVNITRMSEINNRKLAAALHDAYKHTSGREAWLMRALDDTVDTCHAGIWFGWFSAVDIASCWAEPFGADWLDSPSTVRLCQQYRKLLSVPVICG